MTDEFCAFDLMVQTGAASEVLAIMHLVHEIAHEANLFLTRQCRKIGIILELVHKYGYFVCAVVIAKSY